MIGRVLRPAEGKTDAIVLDHSGAVFRHGFVEDAVELDARSRAPRRKPGPQRALRAPQSRLLECTQCGAIRVAGEPCAIAGSCRNGRPDRFVFAMASWPRSAAIAASIRNLYDPETRRRWHAMLAYIAKERGYKPGWAAYKFKEKFGTWPPWGEAPWPIPPTPEVRSWVRSRHDRLRQVAERGMNKRKDQRPIRETAARHAEVASLSRAQPHRAQNPRPHRDRTLRPSRQR